MKSNFSNIFLAGLLLIIALPLLNLPPWFSPPDWGKAMVFQPAALLLAGLFLAQLLLEQPGTLLTRLLASVSRKTGAASLPLLLLTAFGAIFFLAVLFSQDRMFSLWGDPSRAGGFVNIALFLFLAAASFLVLKSSQWNILWNWAFVVGILVSVVALFQQFVILSDIFVPLPGQVSSTLGGPWVLGMYLVLLSFPALAFGIREQLLLKKFFYFFGFVLFGYTVLLTVSQAAYLGFGIGLLYFLFLYPVRGLKGLPREPSSKIALDNFNKQSVVSSNGVYPHRLKLLKILAGLGIVAVLLVLFFLQAHPNIPLSKNPIVQNAINWRVDQSRLSAWKVSLQALQEKPLFGYGPENFSIGFDKHYDPALPGIERIPSSGAVTTWWDRAHNILLDIGVQAGVLAILIYLALLGSLLWLLQQRKHYYTSKYSSKGGSEGRDRGKVALCHGVQAAFLGYFVANLFSFDGFSTYLIFFLLVGYSLFLIQETNPPLLPHQPIPPNKFGTAVLHALSRIKTQYKILVAVFLFGALVWFAWHYNFKPLQVNADINFAKHLVQNKECERAFRLLDPALQRDNAFLNSYLRLSYVDYLQECMRIHEEKKIEFAQRGYELLKENIELKPTYTRNWIFLGGFTAMLVSAAQNGTLALPPERIEELKREAESYFQTALELSPKRQEVYVEWIKYDLAAGQYAKAKEKSQECLALDAKLARCWWLLARAQLSLGNEEDGNKAISQAIARDYPAATVEGLLDLANAYIASQNYRELANIYEQLIEKRRWPEYYAGLAISYGKIGEFEKARQAALKVLELRPESAEEVRSFLESLPEL